MPPSISNDDTGNAGALSVSLTINDADLVIRDNSDTTKAFQFQVSGVTTATTRTLTVPDANTTIVGTDATQTLTNKTLTTPTIASFTNATHNHTNAAGGGQITTAALSNYSEWATFTPTLTASSGTFSATATTAKWRKVGKNMQVTCFLAAATVSATPTTLRVLIPGSFTAAVTMGEAFKYNDNGTQGTGLVDVTASGTVVQLLKDLAGTAWSASAGASEFMFTIEFETTT